MISYSKIFHNSNVSCSSLQNCHEIKKEKFANSTIEYLMYERVHAKWVVWSKHDSLVPMYVRSKRDSMVELADFSFLIS